MPTDPFASRSRMPADAVEYVGFWARLVASLIDTVLVLCVTFPLLVGVYGRSYLDAPASGFVVGPADFLITWVLPAVAVVLFWLFRQATPGRWPSRPAWSMPGRAAR
jgi:uncharacterized RDD family membrane protein YckC